ncbi:DUF4293 domain-containing protein [Bacteroides sp. 224]|uniref:DUF4293 domain-containing protein n=1 Tax=Bacteroides sp. 224 TaxID=2302936 RepID=UPI0013D46A2F|nr:DUF4293 domain-containing protein [Bacteroides sp. 224]NDV64356.1 DUF4293 family protein [Bacteroides sp. 224]
MIQRIQTVYLLLVVALLVASVCLPFGAFVDREMVTYEFTAFGVKSPDGFYSTWGLFSLLLLSTIIAFATILLFKNRVLQLRMCIFNTVVLVGYYIAFLVFLFSIKSDLDAIYQMNWALSLPLVAIIFNYLAIRAIGKDEVLVKAADRLR